MSQDQEERRRFDRVATDKRVVVSVDSEEHLGTVLDLSLRGLLFVADNDWHPEPGETIKAQIQLDGESYRIDIEGLVAHVEGNHIGVRCTHLDLDSARSLRRLVELNLADQTLLERNLSQLVAG